MLKKVAVVFGIALLLVGVLGFVPGLTPDGHLLGLFHVNGIHNVIHLASGAAALLTGLNSTKAARLYFQIFGIVYALVTILGFMYGEKDILGLIANNMGDVVLHIIISVSALALGFGSFDKDANTATN